MNIRNQERQSKVRLKAIEISKIQGLETLNQTIDNSQNAITQCLQIIDTNLCVFVQVYWDNYSRNVCVICGTLDGRRLFDYEAMKYLKGLDECRESHYMNK